MRMVLADWTALALFAGLVLVVATYALALSGHFPAEHRAAHFRTPGGIAVLWGTAAIALGAGGIALAFAWHRIPLPAAIIAGGLAVLVAPLVLQPLPDSFVDGRRGLLVLALAAAAIAALALAF
jgi:hypothetical protein